MKKKLFSLLGLGLATVTLVACGGTKKEESASTPASSSVATAKVTELKPSTVTYMTDEDIEAMQTIGDYKAAFASLADAYTKDFDELIAQLPDEAKSTLEPVRDQLDSMFKEQQEILSQQMSAAGDDSTLIPAEARDSMISSIKLARDQFQQAMVTARQQAESLLNAN